jgi:hypothetical protein
MDFKYKNINSIDTKFPNWQIICIWVLLIIIIILIIYFIIKMFSPSTNSSFISCNNDGDCNKDEKCINGKCIISPPHHSECNNDGDCNNGKKCIDGKCIISPPHHSKCNNDGDCNNGKKCIDSKCVISPPQSECNNDRDCNNGKKCIDGKCVISPPQSECNNWNDCNNPNKDCINGKCEYIEVSKGMKWNGEPIYTSDKENSNISCMKKCQNTNNCKKWTFGNNTCKLYDDASICSSTGYNYTSDITAFDIDNICKIPDNKCKLTDILSKSEGDDCKLENCNPEGMARCVLDNKYCNALRTIGFTCKPDGTNLSYDLFNEFDNLIAICKDKEENDKCSIYTDINQTRIQIDGKCKVNKLDTDKIKRCIPNLICQSDKDTSLDYPYGNCVKSDIFE